MKTSSVCNQKRGVGEFLVADEIAFSFKQSGIPMSFYDLDVQGGTLHRTHEETAPRSPWWTHRGDVVGGSRRLAQGGRRCGPPHAHYIS